MTKTVCGATWFAGLLPAASAMSPLVEVDSYLDDAKAPIGAGTVEGNVIRLKLTKPATARAIANLSGRDRDGKPASLIFGTNGIAALTCCEVPLSPTEPTH